uniref:Uncharacterized protein n=1 Tax=Moschus moschiferus TaxID=68415 RepID=A0A8C6CK13_MOSMO
MKLVPGAKKVGDPRCAVLSRVPSSLRPQPPIQNNLASRSRGRHEATPTEVKTVLKSFQSKGPALKLEVKIDPSVTEKYVEMSANTKIQKLSSVVREIFQKC